MDFLLGATAEALRANIDLKAADLLQRGQFDAKYQIEGVTPTNHSSQKTRLNVVSYGVKSGQIVPLCLNARV